MGIKTAVPIAIKTISARDVPDKDRQVTGSTGKESRARVHESPTLDKKA
jgi:hypothetical protein